jgi:hypothetical protein
VFFPFSICQSLPFLIETLVLPGHHISRELDYIVRSTPSSTMRVKMSAILGFIPGPGEILGDDGMGHDGLGFEIGRYTWDGAKSFSLSCTHNRLGAPIFCSLR